MVEETETPAEGEEPTGGGEADAERKTKKLEKEGN